MPARLLTALMVFACACGLHAQTVPSTGQLHESKSTGLKVTLPPAWSARDHEQGVLLIPPGSNLNLSGADNSEVYIAISQSGYRPGEETAFAEEVSRAFLQGNAETMTGGTVQPLSVSGRKGSLFAWDLRDPASGKRVSFDIYFFPAGDRGFAVIGLGESERVRARAAGLRDIAAKLEYRTPKPVSGESLADDTEVARFWLGKLRGKMIKQFIGGGGTAGQRVHFLAADGSYSYNSSVAIAADVPGVSAMSTSRNSNRGKWRIVDREGQAFLQIVTSGGDTQLMPLAAEGRFWYLNGDKAFAIDPN